MNNIRIYDDDEHCGSGYIIEYVDGEKIKVALGLVERVILDNINKIIDYINKENK